MFYNIGSKIKTLAEVICWLGIIISIIVGIVFFVLAEETSSYSYSYYSSEKSGATAMRVTGLLIMILGSLFSWIGSFLTYGFGQLVENSDRLVVASRGNQSSLAKQDNTLNKEISDKIEVLNKWKSEGLITEEEYQQKMDGMK